MPDKEVTDLRSGLDRFIARLERRIEGLEGLNSQLSWLRIGIFILGSVIFFLVQRAFDGLLVWTVAVLFLAAFSVAVYVHNRTIGSLRRHRIYAAIKRSHIARMDRDWSGLPTTQLVETPPEHAFGRDLNLTGPRSLHHLIDTSFTREGSGRLSEWLLETSPDPAKTRARQTLVQELVALTAFRDRLSLLSALVTRNPDQRWEGDVLLNWLHRHVEEGAIRRVLIGLSVLAAVTVTLLFLSLNGILRGYWLLSLVLYAGIYLFNFRLYTHLFTEAEHLYYELKRFSPIFKFLEKWRFQKESNLKRHCAPFAESEERPSSFVKRIMWLSIAASAQKNEVLRLVLNLILPWELLFTYRLSRYKEHLKTRLPVWLETVRVLEAANSLATFGALNPRYQFPSFEDDRHADPKFSAKAMGHPLIAESVKVRNDFVSQGKGEVALITGSNMSGKSTFLRTIGTNLVLAFAGGPVDADSFSTTPVRLFTCMNVTDSVTDGISYFYAEVRRLKKLLNELGTGEVPLFFLVDEIFRGTNNRERLAGSRAVMVSFVQGNGMGVVSTHDLELVELENEVEHISNFHFRETVADGKMVFDYSLRPGPCPTTNALKIMKMEGLPVFDEPPG